jgi:hypothetical protein
LGGAKPLEVSDGTTVSKGVSFWVAVLKRDKRFTGYTTNAYGTA